MAKQTINVGTDVNTRDGDTLRAAFQKVNDNFDELYAKDESDVNLGAVSESIIPDTDVAYDLGSATNRFKDLYLSGSSIDLGGSVISAVGGELRLGGVKIPTQTDLDQAIVDVVAGSVDLTPYATNADVNLALGLKADLSYVDDIQTAVNADLALKLNTADLPAIPVDIADLTDNTNLLQGTYFDQTLNTTDAVEFASVAINSNSLFDGELDTGLNIRSSDAKDNVYIYSYGSDGNGTGAGNIYVKSDAVEIYSDWQNGGAGEKKWTFTADGSLTFPDATVQTTAYPGIDQTLNTTDSPAFTGLTVDKVSISSFDTNTTLLSNVLTVGADSVGSQMSFGRNGFAIQNFQDPEGESNKLYSQVELSGGIARLFGRIETLDNLSQPTEHFGTVSAEAGRVTIQAYTGGTAVEWMFDETGITFPDLTQQTTAYPGIDQTLNTISDVSFNSVNTALLKNATADTNLQVQTNWNEVTPGQTITADDNQATDPSNFITVWIEGSGGTDYPEITAVQPGWTVTGVGLTNDLVTGVETITYAPGMSVYKITTTTASAKNGYTYTFTEPSTTVTNTNTWAFGSTGSLVFPDLTQQNTAWTGKIDFGILSSLAGEPGDQFGRIILTPGGDTFICTADWQDYSFAASGSQAVTTNQDFLIGQTGGIYLVWSVAANNTALVDIFVADGWDGTSTGYTYSNPSAFTITSTDLPDPTTRSVVQLGINNGGDMYFMIDYAPGDPSTLSTGSSATVNYDIVASTQPDIWNQLNVSNPFDQALNTTDNPQFNRVGLTAGEINVVPGTDFNLYVTPDSETVHSLTLDTNGLLTLSGGLSTNQYGITIRGVGVYTLEETDGGVVLGSQYDAYISTQNSDPEPNPGNETWFWAFRQDGTLRLPGSGAVLGWGGANDVTSLNIDIPDSIVPNVTHQFAFDTSWGFPVLRFPDGTFQQTAMIGDRTRLTGQLYTEAATDSSGGTFGGDFNGSTQTAIDFGPDELNIGLFNITTVATGTITASSVGTSTYSITLNSGTVSPTLTAWAVSPTDIDTAYATAATFHYLGELVTDNGDGTYLFSQVILETDTFPAGTEIRFFDPDGTIRTPADPLSMVWATGASTNVTGVLVFGNQIYNSSPVVVFVSDADVTDREFPVIIQTVGYQDSAATLVVDPDKGFQLRSENSDFFIETDNDKPIIISSGGFGNIAVQGSATTIQGDVSVSSGLDVAGQGVIAAAAYGEDPTIYLTIDGAEGNGVSIKTTSGDGNTNYIWKFEPNGTLILPGEGVIRSIDDTIVLKSYDTQFNSSKGIRIGTNGYVYFELGDDPTYFQIEEASGDASMQANANLNIVAAGGSSPKTWTFNTDGSLTLPGATVHATQSPTPGYFINHNEMQFEVTGIDGSGVVTAITVVNSPNPVWLTGTGGLALGDVNFTVAVDGSGNATVTINSSGSGHSLGEAFTLPAEAFGAVGETVTELDLTKQVQVLSGELNVAGLYSLADGVEGQIMYFVPSSTVTSTVYVQVANARIISTIGSMPTDVTSYVWNVFAGGTEEPSAIRMAIFADGAWCLQGGTTD